MKYVTGVEPQTIASSFDGSDFGIFEEEYSFQPGFPNPFDIDVHANLLENETASILLDASGGWAFDVSVDIGTPFMTPNQNYGSLVLDVLDASGNVIESFADYVASSAGSHSYHSMNVVQTIVNSADVSKVRISVISTTNGLSVNDLSINYTPYGSTQYAAVVKSANQYGAYGNVIRTYNGGDYRYGFNGKEKDDEIKGSGNSYDYGARMYDPRIGRWMAVDPLARKYPFASPYNFVLNTPIMAIDLDGLEAVVVTIRPVQGQDPALTQVNVQKVVSQVDQANLTVTYRRLDAAGNLLSTTTGTNFVAGSVEAQLANATDAQGNTSLQKLQAGTYDGNGGFNQSGNQDPQSVGSASTALNGFQYNLNIQYQPDGYQLNNGDLATTTPQANVNTQITTAQTTLTNNAVPFIGLNGVASTVDLSGFDVNVVGQTDGVPSTHTPQTAGNTAANGNPALAQDRANTVLGALQGGTGLGNNPRRQTSTSTNTNAGTGASQTNRSTNLIVTP